MYSVIKTHDGSLIHSTTEQKLELKRQKELKEAKKRLKTLNKLEEYRHKKLLEEIENMERERITSEKGKHF